MAVGAVAGISATGPLAAPVAVPAGTYEALRPTASGAVATGLKKLPESAIRLLQPFLPRLDMRSVSIDDSSGYSQWLVDKANATALTIGSTIYIQKGQYNTNTVEGLALVGHELTHVQQYRQRGYEGFFWWYGTDYLRDVLTNHKDHWAAYGDIRAEQEAYAMGDRIRAGLQGKLPARLSVSG